MRLRLGLAVLFAVLATAANADSRGRAGDDRAGEFDFYVLALSWSPSYCAAEGANANSRQCGAARPYRFIVHGLWPQYERGYPDFCPTRLPDRVSRRIGEQLFDIIPSMGLIGHQWRKHGTCTGLSQIDYFRLVREARRRVTIPAKFTKPGGYRMVSPADVEARFVEANPGLAASGVAVTCDNRRLREVRICMSRSLRFRQCREVDANSCRSTRVAMPPAR